MSTVVPKLLVIGQGTKFKAKKIEGGGVKMTSPSPCFLGLIMDGWMENFI